MNEKPPTYTCRWCGNKHYANNCPTQYRRGPIIPRQGAQR